MSSLPEFEICIGVLQMLPLHVSPPSSWKKCVNMHDVAAKLIHNGEPLKVGIWRAKVIFLEALDILLCWGISFKNKFYLKSTKSRSEKQCVNLNS